MSSTTHVRVTESTRMKIRLISAKLGKETAATLEQIISEWMENKGYKVNETESN